LICLRLITLFAEICHLSKSLNRPECQHKAHYKGLVPVICFKDPRWWKSKCLLFIWVWCFL